MVLGGHPGRRAFGEGALRCVWRLRAESCDALRVRRCSLRSRDYSDVTQSIHWRHRAETMAGILPANEKGRLSAA